VRRAASQDNQLELRGRDFAQTARDEARDRDETRDLRERLAFQNRFGDIREEDESDRALVA